MGCRCYILPDFVQQLKSKKSCLTSTKSCDVRLKLCLTENWQLLNIKLVELNQGGDNDRLILISTFFIEHKFCGTKSQKWLCSTKNVKFNNGQKLYIFC
jgi:hypothetical protein